MTDEAAAIQAVPEVPKPVITMGQPVVGGLVPKDFDQLYRMSRVMAASGMMPKGCAKPEQVFVAVQMGLEIGLAPMQAVQNIAVINGRPSVWGDAALALVRASGQLDRFAERALTDEKGIFIGYRCIASRVGDPDVVDHTFTLADAKQAGLGKKPGPWQEYPKRMCQMRARGFALRDLFPDVLKGLAIAEEARDMPTGDAVSAVEAAPSDALRDRLEAATIDLGAPFDEDLPPIEPTHESVVADTGEVITDPRLETEEDGISPEDQERLKRPARSGNWTTTVTTLDQKYGPDIDEAYLSALVELGADSLTTVPAKDRKRFVELVETYMES